MHWVILLLPLAAASSESLWSSVSGILERMPRNEEERRDFFALTELVLSGLKTRGRGGTLRQKLVDLQDVWRNRQFAEDQEEESPEYDSDSDYQGQVVDSLHLPEEEVSERPTPLQKIATGYQHSLSIINALNHAAARRFKSNKPNKFF